jgi:hypothetical protein
MNKVVLPDIPFYAWNAAKISRHPLPSIMSMQTVGDVPLLITSENSSSERRITPSWTIGQLKAKLEPVTGIPPPSQKLTLRVPGQQGLPVEAADEESTQLSGFPLAPYVEIHVSLSCYHRMLRHVRRAVSSILLL